MSEDLSKLLSGMLSNPDALKNLISATAGSITEKSVEPETSLPDFTSALNHTEDRRITLLNALKPYMGAAKSQNVDKAIQLIKLTKLAETLRNEGK